MAVVIPELVRIPLRDGHWIEIRKRVTYGEANKARAAAFSRELGANGRMQVDMEQIGKIQIMSYLLNWSQTFNGEPIPVNTPELLSSALDNQDEDTINEITDAISAHIEKAKAKKNVKAGEKKSSRRSLSAAS